MNLAIKENSDRADQSKRNTRPRMILKKSPEYSNQGSTNDRQVKSY